MDLAAACSGDDAFCHEVEKLALFLVQKTGQFTMTEIVRAFACGSGTIARMREPSPLTVY
jgi:hypothetical protein